MPPRLDRARAEPLILTRSHQHTFGKRHFYRSPARNETAGPCRLTLRRKAQVLRPIRVGVTVEPVTSEVEIKVSLLVKAGGLCSSSRSVSLRSDVIGVLGVARP